MKKVLLTKTQKNNKNVDNESHNNDSKIKMTPIPKIIIPNGHDDTSDTYKQRKSLKPYYSEFFSVLLRLPDKGVQQRVLNAINGRPNTWTCKQCLRKSDNHVTTYASVSTQTDGTEECTKSATTSLRNSIDSPTPSSPRSPTPVAEDSTLTKPAKRGRRKKVSLPQVVKRSHAQMVQQEREEKQLTPVPAKKRKAEERAIELTTRKQKVPTTTELASNDPSDLLINLIENSDFDSSWMLKEIYTPSTCNKNDVVQIMCHEYKVCEESIEGLLPIHNAIIQNDTNRLHRQLYVWTRLKRTDINDVLTDDGEDCLQLAIEQDSLPSIVRLLLREGKLNTNMCYDNSNNIIHMALINDVQLESLEALMERVDLHLMLQTNDEGYTAMHIAVRHNLFRQAEIICNVYDKRTLGMPQYRRLTENPEIADEMSSDEQAFSKYYATACDELSIYMEKDNEKVSKQQLKRQLLDMGETRGGNTALYYAIESEMEHFAYFLLAHLCDPNTENHSGQTPKLFHYEYARTLQINLKVARIMEKVTDLLKAGY